MSGPSRRVIDASYHPQGQGGGPSPSLQRARKPFRFGNAIIGTTIALFAAGVYTYSISSVKQDDFSDVEDLLPPLAERSGLRSIEDEARAATAAKEQSKTKAFQSVISTLPSRPAGGASAPSTRADLSDVPVTGSFGAPQPPLPSSGATPPADIWEGADMDGLRSGSRGLGGYLPLPKRLDDMRWVRERGLVELGKGNVIVWGAPNVEKLGRVGDGGITRNRGGRLV
ncbi:putative mitochondrion protein [Dioszegia hungarica]|uniref:Cytochrome c oxidase assembly factor 3 n=1 Tax=Dioszegia hungarica TaxID=4972 RepID=A0AA38H2X9_9TREE|nr:putative mitochondrion protein [Dioszegia hungarica]KAI9633168.1 putative mitochondrion protein [Dioszegia hungarica]